jgi:microcystin-dependent protein
MTDQFVAEIRVFPFNFAPQGWAMCNGQIISISQNTALFSLLGTNYGGNGLSTFGLPNFQGTVPISQGQGPGLSPYFVGEQAGTASVTLLQGQMPAHSHGVQAEDPAIQAADQSAPASNFTLAQSTGGNAYRPNASTQPVTMNPNMIPLQGGGGPHNNLQPYLTLNFCIALSGIFPPRS